MRWLNRDTSGKPTYHSNTLASAGLRLCSSVFWSADKLISLDTLTLREADFARSMTSCLFVVASWEMAARTYRVGAILSETTNLRKLSLFPSSSTKDVGLSCLLESRFVHLATSPQGTHAVALLCITKRMPQDMSTHVLVVINTKPWQSFL